MNKKIKWVIIEDNKNAKFTKKIQKKKKKEDK